MLSVAGWEMHGQAIERQVQGGIPEHHDSVLTELVFPPKLVLWNTPLDLLLICLPMHFPACITQHLQLQLQDV